MARQRELIDPTPVSPPRVGLVAQAPGGVVDGPWGVNGFTYQPEACGDAGTFDPCDSGTKEIGDNPDNISFQSFGVFYGESCSSFGTLERPWRERLERALLACESKQIESELWTGDLAQAESWESNKYLTSQGSDVLTSSAASATNALACLEEGLAECGCGARGMIHASRQLVTQWHAGGALRRDGNQILTINDTIVIPGAGYTGSAPDGQVPAGASQWAYATGMVTVRRSPITFVPDGEAGDPKSLFRQALARGLNTIEIRAERAAAATWDCCHFAAQVDLALCGIGGAGS